MKQRFQVRDAVKFGLLFALWIILSGRLQVRYLLIGVLSSLLVVVATRGVSLRRGHPRPAEQPGIDWVRFLASYLPWLAWQVILANIDVAKRVIHPSAPIEPCILEVPTRLRRGISQTVLGNSITLTPGTVTIDIQDGTFLVHALTSASAEALHSRAMQTRVAELFGEELSDADVRVSLDIPKHWTGRVRRGAEL